MTVEIFGPPKGKRSLNHKIAKHPGVQAKLESTAREAGRRASATLAEHRHDGHSKITVDKGKIDWHVVLNDERGDRAARAINQGTKRSRGIYALQRAFGLGGF